VRARRDPTSENEMQPTTVVRRSRRSHSDDDYVGIHVEGLDDVMVRLAQCCTPVPGDEVMGFVTRGRGVSVHRVDCANAASLTSEQGARLIDVDWDRGARGQVYVAGVEVVALDRSRLLRDVANSLGDQGVNIVSCDTVTGDDRVAKMRFGIELSTPSQLMSVLNTIKRIDGVYDAHRIVPGATTSD